MHYSGVSLCGDRIMKPARLAPLALLAAVPWFLGAPRPAAGQELAQLEDETVLQDYEAPAEIAPHLDALVRATSPSAAIEAYARGRAAVPDSFELTQTFVHVMVALGAPDLCAAQADEVVQRDPSDGLAWGVRAVGRAGSEDYYGALADIATAAHLAPREPFVQRIAGQLLAWYDTKGEPGRLDPDVHQSLRNLRRDFANEDAFSQEYRAAKEYFERPEAAPADQPAQVAPAVPPESSSPIAVTPAPSVVYEEPAYEVVTPTYNVYPETYIDTGWYWGPTYDTYRYSFGTSLYILPRRHYDCWPRYRYPYRYGYRPCPPRIDRHDDRDRHYSRPGWRDNSNDRHPAPRSGITPRYGVPDNRLGRDARTPGHKPAVTPNFKPPTVPGRKPPTVPGVRSLPGSGSRPQRSNPAIAPQATGSRSAGTPSQRSTVSPRPSASQRPSAHVRPAPSAPRHSVSSGSRSGPSRSSGHSAVRGTSRSGGHSPRGR